MCWILWWLGCIMWTGPASTLYGNVQRYFSNVFHLCLSKRIRKGCGIDSFQKSRVTCVATYCSYKYTCTCHFTRPRFGLEKRVQGKVTQSKGDAGCRATCLRAPQLLPPAFCPYRRFWWGDFISVCTAHAPAAWGEPWLLSRSGRKDHTETKWPCCPLLSLWL